MASKKTGVPASTVCFAFCRSSLPAKRTFFLPSRIYARRISEATSVSRGDSELHVATVILFSFRWNRPVFPSVSKLNGNHADLGSISRCDKTGRDSIQRYQLLSLSLSVPFSRAFRASKYFLDREISVGFFDAMFEIFAKFEARFAQLVQSRVNLKVWEK